MSRTRFAAAALVTLTLSACGAPPETAATDLPHVDGIVEEVDSGLPDVGVPVPEIPLPDVIELPGGSDTEPPSAPDAEAAGDSGTADSGTEAPVDSGTPEDPPAAPGPDSPPETEASGLDPQLPPSMNFDLSRWYLTLPSGSTVSVDTLNDGYQKAEIFHTDSATGGLVFRCPNLAGTTSGSSYSRTELREMRSGGGSAKDDANNWTMDEGGTLTATLRVDQVSTTGDGGKVGRVIIGQIHGDDSEPIRLYYDKDVDEDSGRIYAGIDTASNASSFSRDIVTNGAGQGIELGETFSYRIGLQDRALTVRITRADGTTHDFAHTIDAAYAGENLYFKAGVYNQNNTGSADDYVQATLFALDVTHP